MSAARPFRFGTLIDATTPAAEVAARARQVEAFGYDTLLAADHFYPRWPSPGPAMMAAALATSTLRVGCHVFDNDFHHPAMLAKEAACIDEFSGGRLEFGIGAGWHKGEYEQAGIPFDRPGVRVSRLEEAVQIIKGLWADGPLTFSGQYYTITALDGRPKPVQRPHPPLFIGGGGKRLLSFAARQADIVGILGQARPGGGLDIVGTTEAVLAEKIGWVREAAGARIDQLELNMLIWGVVVTEDRQVAATHLASAEWLPRVQGDAGAVTADQLLASTAFLVGGISQIVERLLALRERYGVSYITVLPPDLETFAPVVARLAGQ